MPTDSPTSPSTPAGVPSTFGNMRASGRVAYLGGTNITAGMSQPATSKDCAAIDTRFTRAEFVVRTPAGVTAYTIHYGRWAGGPKHSVAGTELNGWLEDGQVAKTGLVDGQLVSLELPMNGDAPGIYITGIGGTASQGFRFWARGLP